MTSQDDLYDLLTEVLEARAHRALDHIGGADEYRSFMFAYLLNHLIVRDRRLAEELLADLRFVSSGLGEDGEAR